MKLMSNVPFYEFYLHNDTTIYLRLHTNQNAQR